MGPTFSRVIHCFSNFQWLENFPSMYSERHSNPSEIRSLMAEPDYFDDNPELIRPKKLLNPVKASRSHQELHRELLMNQKRGLGSENKPELQRVLEYRRRDQLIRQRKEEEEARKIKSPFELQLQKRQQRLEQLEREQERSGEEQENAPEFIKVKENLRKTSTFSTEQKAG
ncbi:protein FAM107B-like isoform X2 [Hemiscyllium ocellatum]|uniref:protein FAM107B-like isoform X2 n=1 Tax=Hemiscyllium ocellatum TaxID=170820 RepID=UPI0029660D3E|nr:protein FAM107B-like isoform X2 [Hemiscyllium ocellatum]